MVSIVKEDTLRSIFLTKCQILAKIAIPKTHYSREMTIEHFCNFTDLAESLKFAVQDRTGIPAERVSFMIGDELIPDNKTLYDVGMVLVFNISALIKTED